MNIIFVVDQLKLLEKKKKKKPYESRKLLVFLDVIVLLYVQKNLF